MSGARSRSTNLFRSLLALPALFKLLVIIVVVPALFLLALPPVALDGPLDVLRGLVVRLIV